MPTWAVFAAFDGAPEELDITLFETISRDFESIERAASALVAKVWQPLSAFKVNSLHA